MVERLIGAQVVRKTDFLDVLQKVIVEMVAVGIITGERSSSLKQFTLFFYHFVSVSKSVLSGCPLTSISMRLYIHTHPIHT